MFQASFLHLTCLGVFDYMLAFFFKLLTAEFCSILLNSVAFFFRQAVKLLEIILLRYVLNGLEVGLQYILELI